MKAEQKILGCLIGGAAGDALGYAVEFWGEKQISNVYGEAGIREYSLIDGEAKISDDTQMTLFTAAGILLADHPEDYTSFICGQYQACREWLMTQERGNIKPKTWLYEIPEMHARRAPGITCLNALKGKEMGGIYEPVNNSKGCGGVMRVAPIGLFYTTERLSIEEIDSMGAGAAAITHGHPLGFLPAAGLVHIIQRICHNPDMSLLEAVEDMIDVVPGLYPDFEGFNQVFETLMRRAVHLSKTEMSDLDAIHELGEGWVGEEALAIAVYCALKHEQDFDAAICASVNHKGDSDSTGAITGNILGAYLGYDGIPEKYIQNLEMREVIERMSVELSEKAPE